MTSTDDRLDFKASLCDDTAELICDNLDLPHLLRLAASNRHARSVVKVHLLHHLRSTLNSNFHLPGEAFLNTLRSTGAVIHGQGALAIAFKQVPAHGLKIDVPSSGLEVLCRHLQTHGYKKLNDTRFLSNDFWWLARNRIVSIHLYAKANVVVEVTERRDGEQLHGIAKAMSTAHMAFITSDAIHIPFGRLTLNKKLILKGVVHTIKEMPEELIYKDYLESRDRGPTRENISDLLAIGFDSFTSVSWDAPCGNLCPVSQTRILNTSMVTFNFGGKESDTSNFLERAGGQDLLRVGSLCRNRRCENFASR